MKNPIQAGDLLSSLSQVSSLSPRCDLRWERDNSPEIRSTPDTRFQDPVVGDEITIIDLWQPEQTTQKSGHTHTA
jgi:hypothetical protein